MRKLGVSLKLLNMFVWKVIWCNMVALIWCPISVRSSLSLVPEKCVHVLYNDFKDNKFLVILWRSRDNKNMCFKYFFMRKRRLNKNSKQSCLLQISLEA